MKVSLCDLRWRLLFTAGILLLAGGLTFLAGKVWLAAHWDSSSKPENWLRAAKLEPGNADYWHHLGLYEQWDFERGDLRQAIVYYERTVETNPRSDADWMDLAGAYESLGDAARAREAFEKAQLDHPGSAEVAWRYGSFLLRQGDLPAAFAELRRAVRIDPKLAADAVSEGWRATQDASAILNDVLPAQSRYDLLAMDYFLSQHETAAALAAWDRLLELKQPFPMTRAVPLVDDLIGEDRVEEAQQVWQQALLATDWPRDTDGSSSVVFNGGFEHNLVNGGFDWQEEPVAGAAFDFDPNVVHSGKRSLSISFDGTSNLDFHNLWQYLLVEPHQRYRFTAYVRTEEISTDSGVRFQIYDPRHGSAVQVLTPNVVGTEPWSPVETEFTTGPETRLLVLSLRRLPTWKFDNQLRGTVWVDDVSLVPITAKGKGGSG